MKNKEEEKEKDKEEKEKENKKRSYAFRPVSRSWSSPWGRVTQELKELKKNTSSIL
jgi:hypothetical protein